MLFHVEMIVNLPPGIEEVFAEGLKARERARSQELQREGKWRHIWRLAGVYANVSIFDVADPQELHDIMIGLPLFPYMTVTVRALCHHPSALADATQRSA